MPSTGGTGGDITGGQELIQVQQSSASLGRLLGRLITGINTTAQNAAVSPTGEIAAPKKPDSVSIATMGEYVHVSIQHSGSLQRGVNYFTEIDTTGTGKFAQPIVLHHGTSRTPPPFPLPSLQADGKTPSTYQFRSYAQYPSSQPSAPTTVGGASSPTIFNLGGTTSGTLLPSTGSGTAPNTGQSAGQGFGKTQTRTGN